MKLGIRELLFILVMLGVLGSAYFFVFMKANARIASLETDTLAKQRVLSDLRNDTTGISDLRPRIDELDRAIRYFNGKLPPQREVDTILQQISEISQSAGLITRTIRPDRSETNANYSEEPIELSLSGSSTGFYQFLLDLEKLKRLTRLTYMKLSKLDESEGHMTADLKLSVYFAPDVQDSSSAAAQ